MPKIGYGRLCSFMLLLVSHHGCADRGALERRPGAGHGGKRNEEPIAPSLDLNASPCFSPRQARVGATGGKTQSAPAQHPRHAEKPTRSSPAWVQASRPQACAHETLQGQFFVSSLLCKPSKCRPRADLAYATMSLRAS